jgi:hypothetical protein
MPVKGRRERLASPAKAWSRRLAEGEPENEATLRPEAEGGIDAAADG